MSVLRIEEYGDVLKVILKPTKTFPVGYFYTDNNEIARELIESYSWFLSKNGRGVCVLANTYGLKTLCFHQEYAKRILSYYPDYIDHINGLEIDNRDSNLNVVTNQQNIRNRPSRGYTFDASRNYFYPRYRLNSKVYKQGCYKTESEALLATYLLRQQVYADYDYNFFEDRRNFEQLLDLEIRGVVSHEEANYLRAKELIEKNPWYVYRYNLFDYCSQHNIAIPSFDLDSQGFMINPYTELRLCPY